MKLFLSGLLCRLSHRIKMTQKSLFIDMVTRQRVHQYECKKCGSFMSTHSRISYRAYWPIK